MRKRAIEKGKSEFITNISHDLRTPLTSIIGYLALVNEKQYRNKEELEMYIQNTYNLTLKLKLSLMNCLNTQNYLYLMLS